MNDGMAVLPAVVIDGCEKFCGTALVCGRGMSTVGVIEGRTHRKLSDVSAKLSHNSA